MTVQTSRRTPINDEYPTCERTFVTLRIYPGATDPAEVSRRLGIDPTSVRIKDGEAKNSLGRTRVHPVNAWFLSSENVVHSKDVRRHLDWILDLVEPTAERLLELQRESDVRMTVNCTWWSAGGQGGPTLWPEQMARLARLNLECTFDISFYGLDDGVTEGAATVP